MKGFVELSFMSLPSRVFSMEKLNPTLLRVSLSSFLFNVQVSRIRRSALLVLVSERQNGTLLEGFFFPFVILSLKGKRVDFLPDD